MERSRWFRLLIILLVMAVALHLAGVIWGMVQQFSDIIAVFFLAWLVAFVLVPVVDFLRDELGVSRSLAAGLCYAAVLLGLAGFIILILPAIVGQIVQLGDAIPTVAEQVPGWQMALQQELDRRNLDIDLSAALRGQELSNRLTALSTGLVQGIVPFLAGAANVVIAFIITLVVSFYVIIDGAKIRDQVVQLIPDEAKADVEYFLDSIHRTFGGYLRGMLLMSLVYAIGNATLMVAVGLKYVLLFSLFAAFMMVIPFIGPVIALLPPIILAFATGSLTLAIVVAVTLIVFQQIIFNVIMPKFMGETLGIHPVLIFGALLVGTRVGGLAGAVFGVPIAAIMWTMFVLWINRSRFGQLAQARQEALLREKTRRGLADAAAESARRFRATTALWGRLFGRVPPRSGVDDQPPVLPRSREGES